MAVDLQGWVEATVIREKDLQQGPAVSTWIETAIVTEPSRFAAMRAEWDDLLDASNAGVFNSWEWLYPWYRRIASDRQLRILTARARDGVLLGLMPLCLEKRHAYGMTVRRLSFMGETHVGSDYLDVIARRGFEGPIARLFANELRELREAWDVLELNDFSEKSPTLVALREAFGELSIEETPRFICPYETLSEEPFDAFLKRTGRRDNYLRRKKWLEKQPGYRIDKTDSPGALAEPMTQFFRLHSLRWADDGGSQGIKGPSVESFHRDATQLLAERGMCRMYTMRVGNEAVASVYGIRHRDKFIYFQSGYDPAWRNKSVGLVLVGETFKDALEDGLREYDFLRGTESYKADWTTQQRSTLAMRIVDTRGAGRRFVKRERLARRLRDAAKAMLPTNVVEKVRRIRRRRAQI